MRDALVYLVSSIVDHPDDLAVEEITDETRTVLTIHANQEDIGKIIGRNGRIIRAIRDIMKIIATKRNTYVDVVLAEEKSDKDYKSTNTTHE